MGNISVVLANTMDKLSLINGLYGTKDGKMWVPEERDSRYEVFLDYHASVSAGHMGRDKTDDLV